MHIVIDVRSLQAPGSRERGLGYSLRGWLNEFLKMPYEHEVTLLTDPRLESPWLDVPLSGEFWREAALTSCDEVMRVPDLAMEREASRRTETFLSELEADLVHIPSFFESAVPIGLPPRNCPCVVTVHDVMPALFPGDYLGSNEAYARSYYAKLHALRRCEWIIAVSRSSADDLTYLTGTPTDRIDVVYNAPSSEMFVRPTNEEYQSSSLLQRIGQPYIFAQLAPNPTKNVERLLAAFAQLPSDLRRRYKLVVTYKIPDWHQATIQTWLENYQLQDEVFFTDWVSREDIRLLFAYADLYVHPSLYEGFGMPIVEAMAQGTPVAVSDAGSMPEVAGDAALFFDPHSVDDIADTITRVLIDSDLRAMLGSRAVERAQQFDWQESALAVRQSYERALATPEPPPMLKATDKTAREKALLSQLSQAADVADLDYSVGSGVPVARPIAAWIRNNLTSHLREPYFDPIVAQQERFDNELVKALQVACGFMRDYDQATDRKIARQIQDNGGPADEIVRTARQSAREHELSEAYLLAGPMPEYGKCLGREFYRMLYLADLLCLSGESEAQRQDDARLVAGIHSLAWYIEEYHNRIDSLRRSLAFAVNDSDADVVIRGYCVQSNLPVVGSLVAWARRNLTSHLREPYIDPILERQVTFNRLVLDCLENIDSLNPARVQRLRSMADIILRDYEVSSEVPRIGPAIAWVRRGLTSHLREPYIDPIFERQVEFNYMVVDTLAAVNQRLANLHVKEHYYHVPIGKTTISEEIRRLQSAFSFRCETATAGPANRVGFEWLIEELFGMMRKRVEEW